jgi:hypothetical protein
MLFIEKPNEDSLVILHALNEKAQTHGPGDINSKSNADVMPL